MGKGGEGPQQQGKENKITLEELSQHRTPNDAWMSYRGKVYDVSKWEEHPGVCDKEALKAGWSFLSFFANPSKSTASH